MVYLAGNYDRNLQRETAPLNGLQGSLDILGMSCLRFKLEKRYSRR